MNVRDLQLTMDVKNKSDHKDPILTAIEKATPRQVVDNRLAIRLDSIRHRLRGKAGNLKGYRRLDRPKADLNRRITAYLRERYRKLAIKNGRRYIRSVQPSICVPRGYVRATIQMLPTGFPTFEFWHSGDSKFIPITYPTAASPDMDDGTSLLFEALQDNFDTLQSSLVWMKEESAKRWISMGY